MMNKVVELTVRRCSIFFANSPMSGAMPAEVGSEATS